MTARDQSGFAFFRLPVELRLLLTLLRQSAAEEADAIDTLSASPGFSWDRFLGFARHHRVEPLVYHALAAHGRTARGLPEAGGSVPEATLATLRAAANANAIEALRYLAEASRLCDRLQSAGIVARVLKGVPLSRQAFGDPGFRHVGDLDLLIPPGSAKTANQILEAEGFRRIEPAARLTPRRRRSWQRHGKDYTYTPANAGFELDLHWRLFRNPLMPGNGLVDAPVELMRFGDILLPVLPIDRSFLFLCVHSALEGWPRFKSLVDVAALWSRFAPEQRTDVIETARSHRILPELAAALALAAELRLVDEEALPTSLQIEMGGRESRWILRYTRGQHLAHGFLATQEQAGSWALKRYELGLRRGFAYRLEIVRRVLSRPRIWERFDLPDTLFWLYPLLSPMEWLLFHRRGTVTPAPVSACEKPAEGKWARWRRLPSPRKWLLAEAFVSLAAARAALAIVPARRIFRWLERPATASSAAGLPAMVEGVRWAVLTVARDAPISFVCFPQALAAHAMLRRRGIASVMHYGVRRSADRQMRAHTWLEVDGRLLLGGESAPLYAPIHSTGTSRETT